jgi:hypothetical protein
MDKQKSSSSSPSKTVKERARRPAEDKRDDRPTEPEEDSMDRTIEDSFPASDPPSSIPNPDEDAA